MSDSSPSGEITVCDECNRRMIGAECRWCVALEELVETYQDLPSTSKWDTRELQEIIENHE